MTLVKAEFIHDGVVLNRYNYNEPHGRYTLKNPVLETLQRVHAHHFLGA